MKKWIVTVCIVCILWWGSLFANDLESRATTLVNLLEQHKSLTGEAALTYRTKWESILQIAVPQRPDIVILPFLYNAIVTKKATFSYIPNRSVDKNDFLVLVNEVRDSEWLSWLIYHNELNNLAQSYAVYMETNDHFSHTSLSWETLADRIKTVNYSYTLIGENLAKWYTDIAQVLQWWMDIPSHRANIFEPWFIHMGLGRSGEYRVQLFGRQE